MKRLGIRQKIEQAQTSRLKTCMLVQRYIGFLVVRMRLLVSA
jgi:hypothetical protein